MDYFELYETPISLKIDTAYLQKKYYELCRIHHPDHYTLLSEETQKQAENMITSINEGKMILENEHNRLDYILKQKGIVQENEKYPLSPMFLADMMDINEQLMEVEFDRNESAIASIKSELKMQDETLKNTVALYYAQSELAFEEGDAEVLKDYYYKSKYIRRINDKHF
jgi:molecular chaperone HscB